MVNVLLHTRNTRRLVEIAIYGKSLHSNTRKGIHIMHVHTTGEGGESERKKDGGREKERETGIVFLPPFQCDQHSPQHLYIIKTRVH